MLFAETNPPHQQRPDGSREFHDRAGISGWVEARLTGARA
jgi:hypothetical protein